MPAEDPAVEWSRHAREMLKERAIQEEWVLETLQSPDRYEKGPGGQSYYIKSIPEYGNRFLRVVVNRNVSPNRIVTVFFDRRLGRKQ
ncbi:MAG: DUF4258 domain-containing protein [Acidobacteria bacterium]|nr:DUF4258 domain-containing protein [Acidobacteriota bacterium]